MIKYIKYSRVTDHECFGSGINFETKARLLLHLCLKGSKILCQPYGDVCGILSNRSFFTRSQVQNKVFLVYIPNLRSDTHWWYVCLVYAKNPMAARDSRDCNYRARSRPTSDLLHDKRKYRRIYNSTQGDSALTIRENVLGPARSWAANYPARMTSRRATELSPRILDRQPASK